MRSLVILLLTTTGCGAKVILRDTNVYTAELDQYHRWATVQSGYLRDFIEAHCECEGDTFADTECKDAADYVLTIEARADWHHQMSLWNASLLPDDREPTKTPPSIAPLTCPLPAGLTDGE